MGLLAFRFKTMGKNLNPEHKKRKAAFHSKQAAKKSKRLPRNEGILLSCEEWNEVTFATKYMRANEVRPNRVNKILYPKDPSNLMLLTCISDQYPKFQDYGGELIAREFKSLYPYGYTFLGKFCGIYIPRILRFIASEEKRIYLLEVVDDTSDEFKALTLLPEILPSPNHINKKSVTSSGEQRKIILHPSLIRIIDNQENLITQTKPIGPQ